ncbi:hypothetical protein K8R30_01020 [archaeon]|nr:hypothetical protein [archaeon]
MGLRDYVNSRNFAKRINCSELGGEFERSDFARSVEETVQDIEKLRGSDISFEWATGVFGSLVFPIPALLTYGIYKYDKLKGSPSYLLFSNDCANILNRCNLR